MRDSIRVRESEREQRERKEEGRARWDSCDLLELVSPDERRSECFFSACDSVVPIAPESDDLKVSFNVVLFCFGLFLSFIVV